MTGFHERVLVLRVDAGIEIGMGHLMRCTALARAWQKSGGAVVFLSWFEEEVLREHLRRESFPVLPISSPHPAGEDLAETLRVLHDNESRHCGKALLALDGYHFDGTYQQALAGSVERLLVVDDTVRLPYYHADMILNQNLGAEALSYPCDADTVKLLGLRYVLLRPQFAEFMDWRRDAPERARRILVSMGGSEPDNVTSVA
ncbi:MAG: UDP-2,4-diacetamido-2,4,6-trideoxy-beta-L-altropyranose hydrolase, partial [Syntrophales bacterium LBB04]|nr:UDP-2,4-diacetamido-2,4,6-trideoxy-beta-L-altropyranose hydrolase [Syntrophales bacterium LBB04]